MPSKLSQSEKVLYYMISLIYGIQWTKETNKQNRNTFITTENRLAALMGRGLGGSVEKVNELIEEEKPHRHRQQYVDYQRKEGNGR